MSNIIIYSDLQNTYTDHFDVMVNKIEDYVDAYRSILEAIYNQQSLIVVVRNRFSINCFRKMQERYNERILIKVNSPREQFYNMIGIRVPDYITEEEIVKDRLIDKAKGMLFNRGMSFEDNILSHYLGGYFTNPCFPFPKLVDFLKKLDLNPLKARDGGIILNKIYKKRIKLWQENSRNESERNIINTFLDNHEALLTKVSKYLILKKYPKNLIEDIVGNIAKDLDNLSLKDAPFIPKGMDTLDIQRNLRIYFNQNISGFNCDDIIHEIEHLSGLFDEELQYVYNLLNQNQNVLDVSMLYKIRSKFKNGSELDPMFNEKLNNVIPPAEVANPENIDNIDDWVLWALNSYLPYRFWMEANNVYNEQIDKYSLLYGDWVFLNYDKLVFNESRMLYKTIANLSSYLRKDELSLIVIIDNFNYKYVQLCKDYFSIKGFSNTMDQPLISMIPTETSVSKTAFFSGQPFNTEDKSYESMCKEWEVLLEGNIEYLSDIGKLDSIHENSAKVYFLNYLSVDKILHESQRNSALPLSLRIQEELKAMMDKIINFAKRLGMENKIKVYFVSDHGSKNIRQTAEFNRLRVL